MSQDVPEQLSDSDSNFSIEESVNWTPGRKESNLTIECLQRAQKNTSQCHLIDLGKLNQTDVLRTEDFVSFLCMRKEYQHCYGTLK